MFRSRCCHGGEDSDQRGAGRGSQLQPALASLRQPRLVSQHVLSALTGGDPTAPRGLRAVRGSRLIAAASVCSVHSLVKRSGCLLLAKEAGHVPDRCPARRGSRGNRGASRRKPARDNASLGPAGRTSLTRRSSTRTRAPPCGTSGGTLWGTSWLPAATTTPSSSGSGIGRETRWAARRR